MEIRRVFVEKKRGFDVAAREMFTDLRDNLGVMAISGVRILICYDIVIDGSFTKEDCDACIDTVFREPPADFFHEERFPYSENDFVFAVKYLPGQYDQRADSAVQCAQIVTGKTPLIEAAAFYVCAGELTAADKNKIKSYCVNPVDSREIPLSKPSELGLSTTEPSDIATVDSFISMSDKDFEQLYSSLSLAMSKEDFYFCRDYFKSENRDPSITEIRVIDTYWSDHCRHTTFLAEITDIKIEDGKYKQLFQNALNLYNNERSAVYGNRTDKPVCLMDIAVMGMKSARRKGLLNDLDESEEINACSVNVTIEVDGKPENWLVMFKNETHNHPTEIEPFGGAATCLGGAIRDPLSGRAYVYQAMRVTGAGDPTRPVSETLQGKLPQRKLTIGAARGYSSYGNQIGLATGQVSEIYDEGYIAKRLEIGMVVGAVKKENVRRERPIEGDAVLLVGGKTGRDGCGGATGSSKAHDEKSGETCGAEVQKGNPPVERKLQRLFANPAASALIKRCNDFGAGGVSVAIGELADGLTIDLSAVPKKYDGLDGTELAISESQERMAVVVAAEDAAAFTELASEENVDCVKVADVTGGARLVMNWRGKTIVDLSREFLNTNGAKQYAEAVITNPPAETYQAGLASFPDGAEVIARASFRGVCVRGDKVLMIKYAWGGYGFSGGGLEDGETEREAVIREIREEIGYDVVGVGDLFCRVIYRHHNGGSDYFEQENNFFVCEVSGDAPKFQEREFEPVWVNLREALAVNEARPERERDVIVLLRLLGEKAERFLDVKDFVLGVMGRLNVCSQKGLSERFDSTIGAGTVFMPFGGKRQMTPSGVMAAKIYADGETDACTVAAWGFNPVISKRSPFHGAALAVVESVSKIVAAGGDYTKIHLTFQEYFERLGTDPRRWGKPLSALLGALTAQNELSLASIGGKDSMSGSFGGLDVPPTLVSFAVSVESAKTLISPEFKRSGSKIALIETPQTPDDLPDFQQLKVNYKNVTAAIKNGSVLSARVVGNGGVTAALCEMAFGDHIGFNVDITLNDEPNYGAFVLELNGGADVVGAKIIGETTEAEIALINGETLELSEIETVWLSKLEPVFPTGFTANPREEIRGLKTHISPKTLKSRKPYASPTVLIPAFPGTNGETDMARAFKKAGGAPDIFVLKNRNSAELEESLKTLAEKISRAQIIALPGGFSAGDEPDGSGKFIAAVFRNGYVKEAATKFLNERDGLILGICNGFQALIKLGLVPYGEIRDMDETSPTLTFNSIGRHVSTIARVTAASNLSPWLYGADFNEVYSVPVSHGEGRFFADGAAVEKLAKNGQIATRYCDENGAPSMNIRHNPNGSVFAVEGITSPDGRVFGRMGHAERIYGDLCVNVTGQKDMKIFESGVKYFS